MEENLALDEALLLQAESGDGGEVLRLWEWGPPAVVLGAGGRLAADVNEAACLQDQVPILRRASGGGTVLVGTGCLIYTLVLAYERAPELGDVGASYVHILDQMSNCLGGLVPGMGRAGTSDLAVGGRKFSGNAQQRKRDHLVHHGTLLYGFDLDLVGRYLHLPERQPDYRRGRDHTEFLMNLPLEVSELKYGLRQCWQAHVETLTWPAEVVGQLVAEKYGQADWVRRR
jgi:lipoate-protein ligase A